MSRDAKESKTSVASASPGRPRPVLSSSLTEDIPSEDVYVGRLKDRRNTSKAIRMISVAAPGFGHLKRCNGYRLLLAPKNGFAPETSEKSNANTSQKVLRGNFRTPNELKDALVCRGFDLSLLEDEFEVLKVPSKPARTRAQANGCSKIWPVNFHPDPTTESIISGDIFTDYQLARIEVLMGVTIEAARTSSVGSIDCNGSALIVDPSSGSALALASSRLNEHPLWHATMLAVDLVAKIQGGGAWESLDAVDPGRRGSKRKYAEGIPLCYPSELRDINLPEPEPLEIKPSQKNPSLVLEGGNEPTESSKTGPYLCTGFWVFLTQEPCALCAMALLHSRASKIFYGVDAEFGVLRTKTLLHTIPGLNHRYQVWRGVLENESEAVRREIKTREIIKPT